MNDIQTKYSLDLSEFFSQMERVSSTLGSVEETIKRQSRGNPFIKANQSATQFNQHLSQQVQVYQRVQAVETSLLNERKRLETQLRDLKSRQLEFIAAGRYGELKSQIGQVEGALKKISAPLEKADSLWDRIKAKFAKGLSIPKTSAPTTLAPTTTQNPLSGAVGGAVDQLAGTVGVSLSAAGAVAAVGAVVVKSTKEWAEYGKKLSEVSAITGATGKSLQFLDDQALQIEMDTGIAGTVILDAFKSIGSIKPELLENNEALAQTTKEVIALSQASGLDLQQAAISLLGSINQFGEGADQASRFVNVLAAGAKYGASEINETSEALKTAGTTMKATGVSFEQGNALIQSLAGVMIKGSEAGTALRNVLLKLETSADKNLRPSVVGLEKALENASVKYKTTTQLTKVFGLENEVAARRILDTRAEIVKMTKDITGTDVAYEQARLNTDNLATDLQKSGSAITAFFRSLGASQDGFLRYSIQTFNAFLNSLSSKTGSVKAFFSEFNKQLLLGIATNDIGGGISRGITQGAQAALTQRQLNKQAENRKAEIDGITAGAAKSVADQTNQLEQAYEQQGLTVPKAQRAAADAQKKVRDEEYAQAISDHQRLRAEAEAAGRYQQNASQTLKDKFSKQYEESRKRVLASQTAKKLADAAVARLNKEDKESAEALKKLLGEKTTGKADDKALKAAQDSYNLLLNARKEYEQELQKLETQYGKDRLEALDHNSEEYINRKAQLDRDALEVERKHLEELYRISVATQTRINKNTNKREAVIDPNVKLPASTNQIYDNRSAAITAEANRKLEELQYQSRLKTLRINGQFDDLEVEEVRHKWEEIIKEELKGFKGTTDARTKLETDLRVKQQADIERTKIGQAITQIRSQEDASLAFVDTNRFAEETRLEKQNALGIVNLEAEKEKKRLQIRIESGEKLLAYLKAQGEKENAVLITQTQAAVDALKKQQADFTSLDTSSGAGFFGSLLGLGGEELDKFKQAMGVIGASINEVTQAQIQASEQRISALQSEIDAKTDEVKTEEERAKQGYANNLGLRKAELDDLKRQKAEEEAIKRKALKTQQQLDLISTTSDNIATTAKLIRAAAAAISNVAGIPIFGIFLAAAAATAIYATIASFRAKVKAINQLRAGGRIPLSGRSHEQGGHRIEGTDIEVERGEHVINARSSERYDETLEALNQNDPKAAFMALIKQGGFGLPDLIIRHIQTPEFGQQMPPSRPVDFSGMEATLNEHSRLLKELVSHTAKIPDSQLVGLGDGRVIEKTGSHTVITDHRKKR